MSSVAPIPGQENLSSVSITTTRLASGIEPHRWPLAVLVARRSIAITICRRMGESGAGGSVLSVGGDDGVMPKENVSLHSVCRVVGDEPLLGPPRGVCGNLMYISRSGAYRVHQ